MPRPAAPPVVEHVRVAIVGAGPAGLAAAANAARHGVSHVLLDKSRLASTVFEFQKHKHVMAEPQKLPLRALLPFREGTREEILALWEGSARQAGLDVRQAEVTGVRRAADRFEIHVAGEERCRLTAERVVLAIGVQGTPRRVGCPGEDSPHVTTSLSDPDELRGLSILVVGAGDAAIENALALAGHNTVALLNRSQEFARAKEANVRQVTAAVEGKRIRLFAGAALQRIEPGRVVITTPDGEVTLDCDRVIVRAGAVPPRRFLESCGVAFPSADPSACPAVDGRYESNVEGLHLVGALIGYPLIKQALNQGYEVVEHILGNPVEPADQDLLRERLAPFRGPTERSYRRIREETPLFAELSEPQMRELVLESTVHVRRPGEVIFERLDYTDTFFSVISGAVEVLLGEGRRQRLEAGRFFGEMGLLSGRRRAATVMAAEGSILLETPRKQILKLMSSVPSVKRGIDEAFAERLLRLSVYPNADPAFLRDLARRATLRTYRKGEVLFREGDEAGEAHVIRRGSVKVSRRDESGVDVPRTYLAAGNLVGEMALLEDGGRRTGTVTAAVACETLAIAAADFRALLEMSRGVRARVEQLAEDRRIDNVTSDADRRSGEVLDFVLREGVTDASSVLVIDSDLCVACNNCESACAATHGGDSRLDRRGGKFFASVQLAISCRHCENPLCMSDCPPDALVRSADGEVVIRDSCIGCGNCIRNCPYGVIQLAYEKPRDRGFLGFLGWLGRLGRHESERGRARAAKCDMCASLAGGPACVRGCPTGAAVRIDATELRSLLREKEGRRR